MLGERDSWQAPRFQRLSCDYCPGFIWKWLKPGSSGLEFNRYGLLEQIPSTQCKNRKEMGTSRAEFRGNVIVWSWDSVQNANGYFQGKISQVSLKVFFSFLAGWYMAGCGGGGDKQFQISLLSLLIHCWGFCTPWYFVSKRRAAPSPGFCLLAPIRVQPRAYVPCWVTFTDSKCCRSSEGDDFLQYPPSPTWGLNSQPRDRE